MDDCQSKKALNKTFKFIFVVLQLIVKVKVMQCNVQIFFF